MRLARDPTFLWTNKRNHCVNETHITYKCESTIQWAALNRGKSRDNITRKQRVGIKKKLSVCCLLQMADKFNIFEIVFVVFTFKIGLVLHKF